MEWVQILIFVAVLVLFYVIGINVKERLKKKGQKLEGLNTIETSLLALFAFFLGFTFNIAAGKVEQVRSTTVLESNAIGTAILRSQLYGEEETAKFKDLFKQYLQLRIRYFSPDECADSSKVDEQRSIDCANSIWDYANELHRTKNFPEESRMMIPALNDMIDAISTRDSSVNARLPSIIIITLYILSFMSAFIVGFSVPKSSYSYFIGILYLFFVALTVNLILDASNPRKGLITVSGANQLMIEDYNSLNEE